jgi:hypothetical protein
MPMIDDTMVSYGNQSASTGGISAKGLAYLLQYGWSQSLQDAAAGVGAEVKATAKGVQSGDEKAIAKWDRLRTECNLGPVATDESGVRTLSEFVTEARQSRRAAAIVAGTVGEGARGPRLDPMARMVRIVAEEFLRALYARKKAEGANLGPLPTGAALTEMVDRYAAKNTDKVRAEAERRVNATVADVDEDLDEILS